MKQSILVLTVLVLFASCKKDAQPASTVSSPSKSRSLAKMIYSYDNGPAEISEYSYDGQGRISSVKSNTINSSFDYVSKTLLVVSERKIADNSLTRTIVCGLNDKGYIIKMEFKNPDGLITYTYEFTYDGNGYVVSKKGSNGSSGFQEDFVIVDGNAVSSKAYFNGKFTYDRLYYFDKTKENKTTMTHAGYWYSTKLFGKASRNLGNEYKEFDINNSLKWHLQTVYELDALGYPVKWTTNNMLTKKSGITTLSFQ